MDTTTGDRILRILVSPVAYIMKLVAGTEGNYSSTNYYPYLLDFYNEGLPQTLKRGEGVQS